MGIIKRLTLSLLFLTAILSFPVFTTASLPLSELIVDIGFTEPTSDPTADVYIDGRLSDPNKTSSVEVGTHKIRCSKRGYLDFETTINFPAVDRVTCRMSKTAGLTILVRDLESNKVAADVFVDGRLKGNFDSGSLALLKGPHTIRCSKVGYKEFTGSVELTNYVFQQEGTYYNLECRLKRLTGIEALFDVIWKGIVSLFKSS